MPINLSSHLLPETGNKLLSEVPSFCTTPRDTNWLSIHKGINNFERTVRLAEYFHKRRQNNRVQLINNYIPDISKSRKWMLSKSQVSEVKHFLTNVRKEL